MKHLLVVAAVVVAVSSAAGLAAQGKKKPAAPVAPPPFVPAWSATLDKAGEKWVADTLKAMTVDEKIGQLLVTSTESEFLSTDTDAFEALAKKVDRKSTRLNSSHSQQSRMPSSA